MAFFVQQIHRALDKYLIPDYAKKVLHRRRPTFAVRKETRSVKSIKLSDHFTYQKLLRFTMPSIVMVIFSSIYSVVDGLFVANLIGDLALSAVNIMFPVAMIFGAVGFMMGTGGSAIVAKTLGEDKPELANRYFSLFLYAIMTVGALFSVIGMVWTAPIARLAGASDLLMDDCITYGRILFGGTILFMLQTTFHSFFVVAEKPHLGLALALASGIANMALDYVFIGVLRMGIAGAAAATVIGYCVGGIIPLCYFLNPQRSGLRLTRTQFYGRQLRNACINGSSELMSNISASVVSILYNHQLMRLIGEQGVAAFSVMMYVDFAFAATFLGFSMGSAPIVSFHYGAENHDELHSVFRKSMTIIGIASLAMVTLSESLSRPLAAAFVGFDPALMEMTAHGFRLFALCYFCNGLNIYASAFFTALCNGLVSALISFVRTLVLRGGMVLLLPALFGLDGVWLAVAVAETLCALISIAFLAAKRKQYHY